MQRSLEKLSREQSVWENILLLSENHRWKHLSVEKNMSDSENRKPIGQENTSFSHFLPAKDQAKADKSRFLTRKEAFLRKGTKDR